ncbi:MAG: hypothetical protein ABI672_15585 [Vicinamibacteria bacterium]
MNPSVGRTRSGCKGRSSMLHWGKVAMSHALASAACVVVPNAIWAVVYFVALLVAVVTNGPIGSPISFPLTAALITAVALGASIVVFAPATLVASRVRLSRPLWLQAPTEFFVAMLAAFLICASVVVVRSSGEPWHQQVATVGRVSLIMSPGLALYWLVARSTEGTLSVVGRAAAWVRRRMTPAA